MRLLPPGLRGARRSQRLLQRMAHGLMHFAAIAKAHFDFGGVHVHVHAHGVHFKVQHIHRLAVAVQHVFIRHARRMRNDLVAHIAAIDVGVLLVGSAAGKVRQTAAPMHAQHARWRVHGVLYRQAVGHELVSQHIGDAPVGVRRGAPLLNQLAVVPNGKAHIGPHQRVAAHGIQTVGQFGRFAFEELAPRRRAEEQLLDFDRGALGACAGAYFGAARVQKVTMCRICHGRQHAHFRHGRNGRQGFAAKAHGHDRFQIMQVADFAGGMALHG